MLIRNTATRRRGVAMVEAPVILSVAFFFILALIIGAVGVFRFEEMAHLAREGARFALVHGGQYARETGNTAASEADIRAYVLAKSAILDSTKLTVVVTLNPPNGAVDWDSSNKMPST